MLRATRAFLGAHLRGVFDVSAFAIGYCPRDWRKCGPVTACSGAFVFLSRMYSLTALAPENWSRWFALADPQVGWISSGAASTV